MDVNEYYNYWELEEVEINGRIVKFYVVSVLDIPVKLISIDFEYYALWIKDEEDSQLWFLIKMDDKKILEDYLHGREVLGKVFENGEVMIVKRYYETYDKFQETSYNPEKIKFPDYNVKLRKR